MKKFKIGDRVRLKSVDICDSEEGLIEGVLGTIVDLRDYEEFSKDYVIVNFDNYLVINYVVCKNQVELI
jgi:hypothetical protein